MNKILNYIFLFFIMVLMASCASLKGPKYSEIPQTIEHGKTRIVAFRVWSGTGAVWPSHFYIDGKLFAVLNNGGFGYIEVTPGMHQVSAGPENNPTFNSVEIATEDGKVYFVRLRRGMPDAFGEVPPDETLKMLMGSDFKYQPLVSTGKK